MDIIEKIKTLKDNVDSLKQTIAVNTATLQSYEKRAKDEFECNTIQELSVKLQALVEDCTKQEQEVLTEKANLEQELCKI